MDVVWLKRDVRLRDHGPFSEVSLRSSTPFCVLYLYEPDQLAEPTAHGSHVLFANEGLSELDAGLCCSPPSPSTDARGVDADADGSRADGAAKEYDVELRAITVCHADCVQTLEAIHRGNRGPLRRLLAHEETGHWASYQRDRRVRRWCKSNGVRFVEFPQSGATRRLGSRDDFSAKLNAFMGAAEHPTPEPTRWRGRLITDLNLPGRTHRLLRPEDLPEIPKEHRHDRADRQRGGESKALSVMRSFLRQRGSGYSRGISSPNSSWSTCSRLSPYLAWGQISTRHVIHSVRERQAELKARRASGVPIGEDWLRSLSNFLSRMHWRSHFIQKLESEPLMEKRDLCPAYQPLRRQPDDWDQSRYRAWSTGRTGYPFVDACVRCLERHGWLNFRMRAMLVSFACWNLWLDWKRIAPHLGRLFLDFEPGIHYPQLQMQAGTTGINAMRVYNVTKQGRDQDPCGVFIQKYVTELQNVPQEYIHEPWKMTRKQMVQCGVIIGAAERIGGHDAISGRVTHYPSPIVDEKAVAKIAKDRVAAVKKQEATKAQAEQVFRKHGSRQKRMEARGTPSKHSKRAKSCDNRQQSLPILFSKSSPANSTVDKEDRRASRTVAGNKTKEVTIAEVVSLVDACPEKRRGSRNPGSTPLIADGSVQDALSLADKAVTKPPDTSKEWSCQVCTFINDKVHAPVCGMCGSKR